MLNFKYIFLKYLINKDMFREAGAECAERGFDGAVRGRGGAAAARRAEGPRPCPPQRGHGHHQVGENINK